MPTVLLTIEAKDQASSALEQVRQSLASVGTGLKESASAADRVAASLRDLASAAERAGSALEQVGKMLVGMAGSTDSLVGASDKAASALGRQADQAGALAEAYRKAIAAAGDLRAVTAAGFGGGGTSGTSDPAKDPATRSSDRGGAFSNGFVGNMVQGAGFMAMYAGYTAIQDSISRSKTFSQVLGSTAAETGLTASQTDALGQNMTALAAGGKQPYDRTTLLQGAYGLGSLGIGKNTSDFAGSLTAITQIVAQMSGAAGATDLSAAGDAITSLINDYGGNTSNVVANARTYADQLQVATKLGKAELPQFAAATAVPAQLASQLGVSSGDLLGFMGAESAGGIANTDLSQPTFAMLASSMRPNQVQQRAAKGLGIDYDSSFWGKNGIAGGAALIESAMQAKGLNNDQQAQTLSALFSNQAAAKGFMAAENAGDLQSVTAQVQGSRGAVQSAYSTSQMAAGAQLQDAETKLATAFDQLTTRALPALATAANAAATVLDLIGKPKPVVIPGIGGPLGFIGHLADEAAYRVGLANNPDAPTRSSAVAAGTPAMHAAAADVLGTPWAYQIAAQRGGHRLGGDASADTGLHGQAWVDAFATAGRGGATSDSAMRRFSDMVQIAIKEGQPASVVQSALGLYTQAVNQNAALSPDKRRLDILNEEALVNKYIGTNPNAPQRAAFSNTNPLMAGFAAGEGGTVARFGTGQDTQAQIIAHLQQQLTAANRQINLLERLVAFATPRPHAAAHPNLLAGTGVNRMIPR